MAGETFKETLAEAQTYFALSKEEVSKNRRTNDKEVRRSTVNFPIEDNDRRNSLYRYQKTSLSFRFGNILIFQNIEKFCPGGTLFQKRHS